MVLWEITLGTAYFLGLKRTYKLALRIQRKLIGPNHPRIRQVFQSRTRIVFDLALKTHLTIQERDIEVGRNLGNWILRWLDKMKPEAHIRGPPPPNTTTNLSSREQQLRKSSQLHKRVGFSKHSTRGIDGESDRRLFTIARSFWRKPFPSIAIMTKRIRPAGPGIQYRQYGFYGSGDVLRDDIRLWLQH